MAYTKNMTVGNPFPIIFAYFIPVLFSTLCQQLYNIIDTIIVGKGIGDMALAAVGNTGSITFFIFGFIMGLGLGMSILMAQAFGASDFDRLRKTITMGMVTCGIVGIIMMAVSMTFMHPLLVLLKTDELIMKDAMIYIMIILAGIPLTLVYNCFGAILQSLGDSRTPLVAVLLSSGINIGLDLLFIMVFHWGVAGAAIATLIAQGCAGIFAYMKIRKIKFISLQKTDWKLDFLLIGSQFKIGIPLAFMNSITAIGCVLLQYFVNGLGVNYTAAYSACSKIANFMMQPCAAAGMTMSTFAGQNLGAKKIKRIVHGIGNSSIIAISIAIICGFILFLFPRQLASIMLSDEENIAITVGYLKIYGTMMWSISFLFLFRNTLQGMGSTFVPMLSGIMELLARVVVAVALTGAIGFPAIAISEVTAWTAALVLNGIFLFIKLRKLRKQFGNETLEPALETVAEETV